MIAPTRDDHLAVPGPRPARFLGTASNALRFVRDPLGYTSALFGEFGPLVSLAAGGGTNLYSPLPNCAGTVFAYGPELARLVATQHDVYHKFPLSLALYPAGETTARTLPLKHFLVGLFGVNGEEHREQRRLLMPAFHKKRIEAYRDDMVALTDAALETLRVGQEQDMGEVMRLLTMRIATKTLFGVDIGQSGGAVGHILEEAVHTMGSPLTTRAPFDLPGLPYHRFLDLAARFDDEMRALIARKQAHGGEDGDMLALLLQARDAESGALLSEDEVLGHTGVFFAAGHETSANALTWTLFLLSQHPQVAADLLDELDGELHGAAPTVEQLARLPLLEWVVKESMRVLTPVPWNGRVTSQPTELGGYTLPANTEVFVSIYHTHHMADLYPQPEHFDPRRWESISPSTFEYTPFSGGPRMCIGASFAMMEIRLVLAMLLQRYRLQFLPRQPMERAGLIVLTPKHGMPMMVHRQDRRFADGVGGVQGNIREMVSLPA